MAWPFFDDVLHGLPNVTEQTQERVGVPEHHSQRFPSEIKSLMCDSNQRHFAWFEALEAEVAQTTVILGMASLRGEIQAARATNTAITCPVAEKCRKTVLFA